MVDLAEIQAAYYMVAATGVLVAAVYYVMNIRTTQRNLKESLETRRIGIIENIGNRISSEDTLRRYFELMNYEWTDYADFNKKYGTEKNIDASAKRVAQWNTYNRYGMMLRRGLVDVGELYDMGMQGIVYFWEKYRLIIEEGPRMYFGKEYCRDLEYLAVEMLRYMQSRDPSFKVPETLFKYVPNK